MRTYDKETKGCPVSVVANRLEDQRSAELLTAVITDLWDRLPISDLMIEMLMGRGSGATDTERDEWLNTELDSLLASAYVPSKP